MMHKLPWITPEYEAMLEAEMDTNWVDGASKLIASMTGVGVAGFFGRLVVKRMLSGESLNAAANSSIKEAIAHWQGVAKSADERAGAMWDQLVEERKARQAAEVRLNNVLDQLTDALEKIENFEKRFGEKHESATSPHKRQT